MEPAARTTTDPAPGSDGRRDDPWRSPGPADPVRRGVRRRLVWAAVGAAMAVWGATGRWIPTPGWGEIRLDEPRTSALVVGSLRITVGWQPGDRPEIRREGPGDTVEIRFPGPGTVTVTVTDGDEPVWITPVPDTPRGTVGWEVTGPDGTRAVVLSDARWPVEPRPGR